ncbi:MAG: hypothetical protein ACSHXY_02565 [Alphaproteobacteria bacterium]
MFNSLKNTGIITAACLAASLLCSSSASAKVSRTCTSDGIVILGQAEVGSTWSNIQVPLSDSYLQTATRSAGTAPEKARKRACQAANEETIKRARMENTATDFKKKVCDYAQSRLRHRHENAGKRVKISMIRVHTTRERNTVTSSLGNETVNCEQFNSPPVPTPTPVNQSRKNSQFCGDYATSAIKMDLAIEKLGCAVEHHPADGHRNYCSTRSDETVKNGIKHKRGLLNTCLDGLPLH